MHFPQITLPPIHTTPAPISLRGFYEKQPTAVLRAIRDGFERDFDRSAGGQAEYPSTDWLSTRLHLIDLILEQRIHASDSRMAVRFSATTKKNRTR